MPRTLSPEMMNQQNAEGTSLSTAGIIGIIAAVIFLFCGLAWFAWYALGILPRRKQAKLKERKKRTRAAQEHTDRAVHGRGGPRGDYGSGRGHNGI
jgi:hypothetical protein